MCGRGFLLVHPTFGVMALKKRRQPNILYIDWVKQAQESKVPQLMKTAATIMAYSNGILARFDCPILAGKVEGINNKIKVMKRVSYS